MSLPKKLNVFWFRRDLRIFDNAGFFHALNQAENVLPVFIFDTDILENLSKTDARVSFIHQSLEAIHRQFLKVGSGLKILRGKPFDVFEEIIQEYEIAAVYTNRDYEPYGLKRDKQIGDLLKSKGIGFNTYKNQVIFEQAEIVKENGLPYLVYTPFMKRWKAVFSEEKIKDYPSENGLKNLVKNQHESFPSLQSIGFSKSEIEVPSPNLSARLMIDYEATRNFPATIGTSFLGVHLRFGTVSIRQIVEEATAIKNETFLNELIWREFFMQILWHFPETTTRSFKPAYDRIEWLNKTDDFERWKNGETGYPLVDAGMRQLNKTGWMHNRVRMVVASFLCKHLLIDWRWGEAYFAEKLLDYELSSNVGNWQWVAGSGVDAAPYFRIFNPSEQAKKFDPDFKYIRKWVTDFDSLAYPKPMIDHTEARERCLKTYKVAL
ncbi:MAG: deoxyribodipyrimidine photolyase [Flavobacteriales bacterium CG_4_9_14_3_um_filter_40_17]|nr:MAG: deoxyribodipyrimidine photolyase [Flavobacteriales bacterium CG_4_9_14_3_um_filter_40_17]